MFINYMEESTQGDWHDMENSLFDGALKQLAIRYVRSQPGDKESLYYWILITLSDAWIGVVYDLMHSIFQLNL